VALRTLSPLTSSFKEIISQGAPLAIASVCLTLLLYNANSIVLGTLGRTGIFAFAVCMNLLQIYNLFLAGVCRTIQSLGAIQVGKGDNEAFGLVLRKSFSFITVAMILICIVVWVDPNVVSRLFGASDPAILAESNHALRIFSLSFIPFCYIYVIMIVYKLYAHHRMALFISFALSLTVIPVLWLVAHFAPELLWYSYLIAYAIEALFIVVIHRMSHLKFELKTETKK
jgi:Na+-driven multidrug efflux pump